MISPEAEIPYAHFVIETWIAHDRRAEDAPTQQVIVDVLDVRDVFPRVAQTARELPQRVAPAVRERRL